jgi:methyl-accepting chemotaxis protein
LKNLKMIVKLLGGFSIVAIIMLAIGIMSISGVHELNSYVSEIGEVRLPSIQNLLIISEAQTAIDSAENALLSEKLDQAGRQEQYQRFDEVFKRVEEAWAIYLPLPQTIEEAEVWKDFVKAWDNWLAKNSEGDLTFAQVRLLECPF